MNKQDMQMLIERYAEKGYDADKILANMVALGYDKYTVQDMLRERMIVESRQLLKG